MGDRYQATPDRGKTWYNGFTIDTTNYGTTVGLEGVVRVFPNTNVSSASTNPLVTRRDGNDVTMVLVRNVSGSTLYAGNAVVWQAGFEGRRTTGYSRLGLAAGTGPQQIAGIIDDHYGTNGIVNGDLFWLVVKGEVLWKTSSAGLSYSVGDILYALTATTTGSTNSVTGGKPDRFVGTFTSTQTTDGSAASILINKVGRALSALTTSQTNSDMLTWVETGAY